MATDAIAAGEFAAVITALMAGKIDGQQAIASATAVHERLVGEVRESAWVIYDHDHGPYAIALYATCEQAAQYAAQMGYGKVARWPFGMEFSEAITRWEGR